MKRINRYTVYGLCEDTFSYLLLLVIVFFAFFPILLIIFNAFRDPLDIWSYPPKLLSKLTIQNFIDLIRYNQAYVKSFKNSLIITIGGLAITLFCSFAASFAMSRYKNKGTQLTALFLIAIRMFPPIVITIPLYPFLRSLGLVDKHITLMIINAAFAVSFSSMLMKAFVDDVPIELEESAMIEGCSKWRAFLHITLPLTAPGVIAVGIFAAIGIWNEYTFAFIFTTTKAITVPLTINTLRSTEDGILWGIIYAACVLQYLPMLIMVIITYKYRMRGLTAGAIK
jgi:multiple sugar transport system permease protein